MLSIQLKSKISGWRLIDWLSPFYFWLLGPLRDHHSTLESSQKMVPNYYGSQAVFPRFQDTSALYWCHYYTSHCFSEDCHSPDSQYHSSFYIACILLYYVCVCVCVCVYIYIHFFFLFRATSAACGSSQAGTESELQLTVYATATASWIQAISLTCAAACSNTGYLTH